MPYLFAHFKEKLTPDGEQVYFGISKDGFTWEAVNGGNPILTAKLGEKGCRDITVIRLHTGGFVVLTTDLCIVYHMDENHNVDWKKINSSGSKCLRLWKTDDLVHFSEEKLIHMGRDDFGCLWAPEIFFDEINEEYLIHWGSTLAEDNFTHMSIFCCTTKDFETFSEPKLYFTKNNEILDSHITKIGDTYHLFYKNADHPPMNMHATSDNLYGPFVHDEAFEKYMETFGNAGAYEGPTTYILPDGRWCLMLDFFGCEKEKMGYVPFISETPGVAEFERRAELVSFPYGFKHGGVIEITDEEYERLKNM
ncbi:MAG: glycoside hydrolase family 43 protein [Clostridia bacterium]|nr:glycoside hydrolase family 43 protein [Clostridia bacterium]